MIHEYAAQVTGALIAISSIEFTFANRGSINCTFSLSRYRDAESSTRAPNCMLRYYRCPVINGCITWTTNGYLRLPGGSENERKERAVERI